MAAATAAECAKGRPVPPQKMVEDELAEQEEKLLEVGGLTWDAAVVRRLPIMTRI